MRWLGGASVAVAVPSLAGMAGLAGCSLRRDDVPAVTVTGPRPPAPDEPLLRLMLGELAGMAGMARTLAGTGIPQAPLAAAVAPLHDNQHRTIRDILARAGVPGAELDAVAPTATPVTVAGWIDAEAAALGPARLGELTGSSAANTPLLIGVTAMRGFVADSARGAVSAWTPTSAAADRLLPSLHALTYRLEFAGARTSGTARALAGQTVARLAQLRALLEGVTDRPVAPLLAYPLPPGALDTPASGIPALAASIVAAGVDDLVAAVARLAAGGAESADLAAGFGVAREVAALAWPWGVARTAFPGTALPGTGA